MKKKSMRERLDSSSAKNISPKKIAAGGEGTCNQMQVVLNEYCELVRGHITGHLGVHVSNLLEVYSVG